MNKLSSIFRFLLVSTSLASLSSCLASDNENDASSLSRLPSELQATILEKLSFEEQAKVATTCKAWSENQKVHLIDRLRMHRNNMLHDLPSPFENCSAAFVKKSLDLTFETDGLVFVPFGQTYFAQKGVMMCEADVMPLLPRLYQKAFNLEQESFSDQDILCLKAVMPWSHIFVQQENSTAKQNALSCLENLKQNPDFVRFSSDLSPEILKESPKTLLLTSWELDQHQDILPSLFEAHPDQKVHLVVDASSVQEGCFSLSATSLPKVRHLILSDPNAVTTSLGEGFLQKASELISFKVKNFSTLTSISPFFATDCLCLTSFDLTGFSCVTQLGNNFMRNIPLSDEAKKHIHFFLKKVEASKLKLFIESGALPEDFTIDRYLMINPDIGFQLKTLEHPRLLAIDHYAQSGKSEGRSYK